MVAAADYFKLWMTIVFFCWLVFVVGLRLRRGSEWRSRQTQRNVIVVKRNTKQTIEPSIKFSVCILLINCLIVDFLSIGRWVRRRSGSRWSDRVTGEVPCKFVIPERCIGFDLSFDDPQGWTRRGESPTALQRIRREDLDVVQRRNTRWWKKPDRDDQ